MTRCPVAWSCPCWRTRVDWLRSPRSSACTSQPPWRLGRADPERVAGRIRGLFRTLVLCGSQRRKHHRYGNRLSNSVHVDDLAGQRLRSAISSREESTGRARNPSELRSTEISHLSPICHLHRGNRRTSQRRNRLAIVCQQNQTSRGRRFKQRGIGCRRQANVADMGRLQ